MRKPSRWLAPLVLAWSVGCSYTVASVPPPPLSNLGPDVKGEAAPGDVPSAMGGVIADGTYHLTAVRAYQELVDAEKVESSLRITLRITGTDYEGLVRSDADPDQAISGTLSFMGTQVVMQSMSIASFLDEAPVGYSVLPTSLELYSNEDSPVVSHGVSVQPAVAFVFTRD